MENKGFTLVELLATIVIISLIGGIASLAYTSIIKSSEDSVFKTYENTMRAEAIELLAMHVELIPTKNNPVTLSLTDLKVDPINNPKDKNDLCPTSYVKVTRDDYDNNNTHVDAFKYKVCLICNDYKSDGC